MELDWSPQEEAFRKEVRTFIAEELTDEVMGGKDAVRGVGGRERRILREGRPARPGRSRGADGKTGVRVVQVVNPETHP